MSVSPDTVPDKPKMEPPPPRPLAKQGLILHPHLGCLDALQKAEWQWLCTGIFTPTLQQVWDLAPILSQLWPRSWAKSKLRLCALQGDKDIMQLENRQGPVCARQTDLHHPVWEPLAQVAPEQLKYEPSELRCVLSVLTSRISKSAKWKEKRAKGKEH
jgi:hypothetical protein